ncbi:MAG: DUF3108 domain-containing protein [Mariprofundaceae bacterium]|nr:DUF3108 domain-containing protein [Mariprofundaceae bacterium]
MVEIPTQADAACIDSFVGERLEYQMGWEFIMAGTASLHVGRDAKGHHEYITARTNKLFDVFKKVRDRIKGSGYCDQQGQWRSTKFQVNQQERRYKAEKLTVFSPNGSLVHYTQNNKTDDYPVTPNHLQVLDAFYKARSMPMALGSSFSIPVFDSRKSYDLVINVQAKTVKIIAPWGETVACIVVTPLLKTAGVFSSKGKIKIWMTHDARHIPLKMSAKIKIGRIMGYLTHYQAPPPP